MTTVQLESASGRNPAYQTESSAGADLEAFLPNGPITLESGDRLLIPTGLKIALPTGFEGQIRPRSGLSFKYGVTVLNSPGTIDADYRGEVKVLLINLGSDPFVIKSGDRIAQLVVAKYVQADFVKVESLSTTARGEGGFGSTGVATSMGDGVTKEDK